MNDGAMTIPHPQVVRVYATTQDPDYDCPWQVQRPHSSSGSGVLVSPTEILTGAHVVANATFLQVQKISDPNKTIARVKAVCHDCDLALLSVDSPDFLKGIPPSDVGDLPHFRDKVSVVGFPMGGEELSITEGIVSRIEVQRYSHSQRHLLAVTVDAAINDGNSGGPVFKDDKIAGIAFQKISGADNIGEMVPAPIIKTFLQGVRENRSVDIPGLGIATQNLENPQLRKQINLPPDASGIILNAVEYGTSAWGVLQPRDAILEIDGLPIANNGTVRYRDRYRTRYDVVLANHFIGETITMVIWRKGQRQIVELTLAPYKRLVPRSLYDTLPTYFVYGGLVFQTLTHNFLATWDQWWDKAPSEFVQAYYYGISTPEQQELIILSQVLSDEVNIGYPHLFNESVRSVNGQQPRHMQHFMELMEAAEDIIELTTSSGHLIVFDTKEVKAATPRILERYHITHDRSLKTT